MRYWVRDFEGSGGCQEQRLDRVRQGLARAEAVKLYRGSTTQQRFHLGRVTPDFGLLLGRLSVRVVRSARDAAEEDAERRAQQDYMVEPVVEVALVSHRPGDHNRTGPGEQGRHARLIP